MCTTIVERRVRLRASRGKVYELGGACVSNAATAGCYIANSKRQSRRPLRADAGEGARGLLLLGGARGTAEEAVRRIRIPNIQH